MFLNAALNVPVKEPAADREAPPNLPEGEEQGRKKP